MSVFEGVPCMPTATTPPPRTRKRKFRALDDSQALPVRAAARQRAHHRIRLSVAAAARIRARRLRERDGRCPADCTRPCCAGRHPCERAAFDVEPLRSQAKAWRAHWDTLSTKSRIDALITLKRQAASAGSAGRPAPMMFLGRPLCTRAFRRITGGLRRPSSPCRPPWHPGVRRPAQRPDPSTATSR